MALIVKVFIVHPPPRKPLVLAGYSLAAVSKLAFPLATAFGWVVAASPIGSARLRGAPRDALIADITPADVRGTSFGLRRSTLSAASAGRCWQSPGWAYFADNFQAVFWVAVIPACVRLLVFGVKEPERTDTGAPRNRSLADVRAGSVAVTRSWSSWPGALRVGGVPRTARAERRCAGGVGAVGDGDDVDRLRDRRISGGRAADRGQGPLLLCRASSR